MNVRGLIGNGWGRRKATPTTPTPKRPSREQAVTRLRGQGRLTRGR